MAIIGWGPRPQGLSPGFRTPVIDPLVTPQRRGPRRLGDRYGIPRPIGTCRQLLDTGPTPPFVPPRRLPPAPAIFGPLLRPACPNYVEPRWPATSPPPMRAARRAGEAARCSLMVVFNRRYAPTYAELQRARAMIVINRKRTAPACPATLARSLRDFIHVVDTLLAFIPARPAILVARVDYGTYTMLALLLTGDGLAASES